MYSNLVPGRFPGGGGIAIKYNGTIPKEVLSSVYGAATEPLMWQEFCDTVFRCTGSSIMFFAHHVPADQSLGVIGGGYDPAELQRYHDHYADQNPWMKHNHLIPVGMVGVSEHTVSRDELTKTEFYNDWFRHQDDIIGGLAMICHRDDENFAAVAMGFQASRFDENLAPCQGFLEALSPHLTRSIEMSKLLTAGNGGQFQHLETAPQAVVLIHRSGKVAHVNQAGETLIASNGILSLTPQNNLTSANDDLRGFIMRTVNAIHVEDFAGLPSPLRLTIKDFGNCVCQGHIFPEAASVVFPVSAWSDPVAGAIVVTGEGGFDQMPDYRGLVEAFGATKAEIRLAQALINGQALHDYADQNSLSRHTVRNQMRSLRLKTDCVDKADFIRKMLNLASPFSNS